MAETFLYSLGLTLFLELAAALVFIPDRGELVLVALVNLLTNPAALLLHLAWPGPWVTLILEAGVVAVEAVCYKRYSQAIASPWGFSLTANLFSFLCGFLV